MRPRTRHHLLLALALVLGQWLVFAHAHAHPALVVDLQCQVCVHAPGLDGAMLVGKTAALAPPPASSAVPARITPHTAATDTRRQPIRGPPAAVA